MPQFTSSDGLDIHYRVLGEGKPVILVHGWMTDGTAWNAITDALTGAGLQLFIPDQRGTGESAKPERGYGIEQYADDVAALAKAEGLERFSIVGHSMGGLIAQVAAAALGEAVARLVLLCSVPAAGLPLPEEAAGLFLSAYDNPEAQNTILGMACLQLDDAGRELLLRSAATVSKACIEQSFHAWTTGGFADRLKDIRAETFVYGTDDPFLPPEVLDSMLVQRIDGAKFVHQPGPGHYPHVETPAVAGEKLAALLA
ncbi:alpha/beta hydrolase [Pseudenhygromyxa sp. WMMC2535]|uniref:alpha/beta fold hydrolase n=1 Tax=Pseudenhygromyxa sp. WMMC2535 TaxID=2712867 RepID=UPI001552C85E|nr:alpha/beta hydrolase [Pseudenhygromyxa sp. WMMC2535]NVB38293.1 alpha/beta hydrolase [Pseudenhygromyxa sp. WMMC2535]